MRLHWGINQCDSDYFETPRGEWINLLFTPLSLNNKSTILKKMNGNLIIAAGSLKVKNSRGIASRMARAEVKKIHPQGVIDIKMGSDEIKSPGRKTWQAWGSH
jgi:hypothetical protein